jgi:site-specific recombinase XerD
LWIIEKRKAGQKRRLTISASLAKHIEVYSRYRQKVTGQKDESSDALFESCHRGGPWKRDQLSRNGVRDIIKDYGLHLGLSRGLFPHALRHTAISKLGKEAKGDVIVVQEFSGHVDINTLMIYARQARDRHGELSNTLSNLLNE